jgi:bacterioferritin-associated ferredoxin
MKKKDQATTLRPDDGLIICRCEHVTVARLREALLACDAHGVNSLKKQTRAGMGACQGRTCARLLERFLQAETGRLPSEPYRTRPPVRGLPLKTLAAQADHYDQPAGPVSVIMLRAGGEDHPESDDDDNSRR